MPIFRFKKTVEENKTQLKSSWGVKKKFWRTTMPEMEEGGCDCLQQLWNSFFQKASRKDCLNDPDSHTHLKLDWRRSETELEFLKRHQGEVQGGKESICHTNYNKLHTTIKGVTKNCTCSPTEATGPQLAPTSSINPEKLSLAMIRDNWLTPLTD